tara:strand:- start:49995 stop:50705 length:711 start_codon:yes stop_codon:yes gene_type:complete
MKEKIIFKNVSLFFDLKKNYKNNKSKKTMINSIIDKNISGGKIIALNRLNIELEEKNIYGLYGPNGSGKSCFLKLLAKINHPSIGNIHIPFDAVFLGTNQFSFEPRATGEENAKLYLKLKNVSEIQINEKIDKIRSACELGEFFYQQVHIYSSGMMMRLAFACSQMINSELLLMDEWVSTADKDMREYIYNSLNNKIEKSKITVIASHNIEVLKQHCTKIIFFKNGQIEEIRDVRN